LLVEEAQIVVHEADQPDVVSDFPDADVLASAQTPKVSSLVVRPPGEIVRPA
jgi:hypothetical protein